MIKHQKTKNALWIAGLAGTATSANAALVQIDLSGLSVTAGGNALPSDVIDLLGTGTVSGRMSSGGLYSGSLKVLGADYAFALSTSAGPFAGVNASESFSSMSKSSPGGSVRGGLSFMFTINGVTHAAKILVTSGGLQSTRGVTLNAIVYDDAPANASDPLPTAEVLAGSSPTVIGSASNGAEIQSIADANAVPEPSSLGLLAMGAAGLVTRRQRKKTA